MKNVDSQISGLVRPGAGVSSISTTFTDVPGTYRKIYVPLDCFLLVHTIFDFHVYSLIGFNASELNMSFNGALVVDGVRQEAYAQACMGWGHVVGVQNISITYDGTGSQVYRIPIRAGSHSLKLQIRFEHNPGADAHSRGRSEALQIGQRRVSHHGAGFRGAGTEAYQRCPATWLARGRLSGQAGGPQRSVGESVSVQVSGRARGI